MSEDILDNGIGNAAQSPVESAPVESAPVESAPVESASIEVEPAFSTPIVSDEEVRYFHNGQEIVEKLGNLDADGAEECKLADGTTTYVPKSVFGE